MPLRARMASLAAEAVTSNHDLAESVPDHCIAATLRMLHSQVDVLTAIHEWMVTGESGEEARKAISSLLAAHEVAIDVLEERQRKLN